MLAYRSKNYPNSKVRPLHYIACSLSIKIHSVQLIYIINQNFLCILCVSFCNLIKLQQLLHINLYSYFFFCIHPETPSSICDVREAQWFYRRNRWVGWWRLSDDANITLMSHCLRIHPVEGMMKFHIAVMMMMMGLERKLHFTALSTVRGERWRWVWRQCDSVILITNISARKMFIYVQ